MKTRTLVLVEKKPERITVFPDTPNGNLRAYRLYKKLSSTCKGCKKRNEPELVRFPVRWASGKRTSVKA